MRAEARLEAHPPAHAHAQHPPVCNMVGWLGGWGAGGTSGEPWQLAQVGDEGNADVLLRRPPRRRGALMMRRIRSGREARRTVRAAGAGCSLCRTRVGRRRFRAGAGGRGAGRRERGEKSKRINARIMGGSKCHISVNSQSPTLNPGGRSPATPDHWVTRNSSFWIVTD